MTTNQDRFKYEFCEAAALAGDLDELKNMHENGCEWDVWTPAYAAVNGHLDCLRYAHENGCEWDYRTPMHAAKNGHLECLKYAHENGCPWDGRLTTANADLNGQLECFKCCFEMSKDPQEFWKHEYSLVKIIDKIDLDDPMWRKLFALDLSKHPKIQSKVNAKKQEIEEMKEASKDALQNTLPMDVIKYCLQPYF